MLLLRKELQKYWTKQKNECWFSPVYYQEEEDVQDLRAQLEEREKKGRKRDRDEEAPDQPPPKRIEQVQTLFFCVLRYTAEFGLL